MASAITAFGGGASIPPEECESPLEPSKPGRSRFHFLAASQTRCARLQSSGSGQSWNLRQE